MELFLFIILFLVVIVLAAIGLFTGNFWVILPSCILAIVLGLLMFTDGLESEKIVNFEITDNNVTPQYATYQQSDMTIYALSWLLLGGGLVLLFFSAYYSFYQQPLDDPPGVSE